MCNHNSKNALVHDPDWLKFKLRLSANFYVICFILSSSTIKACSHMTQLTAMVNHGRGRGILKYFNKQFSKLNGNLRSLLKKLDAKVFIVFIKLFPLKKTPVSTCFLPNLLIFKKLRFVEGIKQLDLYLSFV